MSEIQPHIREFLSRHQPGDVVQGTVVNVAPFGAFVEVADDVRGLVHVSETTESLTPGTHVEATILDIDVDNGRMSLRPT